MKPTTQEMKLIVRMVEDLSGIHLDAGKQYLIIDRLTPLMNERGISSFYELYSLVQKQSDRRLRMAIIDAITTNETLFFRDDAHYGLIQNSLIPELVHRGRTDDSSRRIRVWSAACSTGQEPYSLAILFLEQIAGLSEWDVEILATDISESALERARTAWYTNLEIARGIAPGRRARYFTPQDGGWRLREDVRSLVTFRPLNLLQPFSFLGPFDLVLCRNVAIYFKPDVRVKLFGRLAGVLETDGALLTGGSESLDDLGGAFDPIRLGGATFYRHSAATKEKSPFPTSR